MQKILVLGSLAMSVGISGCMTVGPDYQQSQPDAPDSWLAARHAAGLDSESPGELGSWWQTLDDPLLDDLVTRAIRNNLDLQAAAARVRQARAQRSAAASDRFPTIQTDVSAARNQTSANVSGIAETSALYAASFDASWELDTFGGIKRSIEAAEADTAVQQEALRNTLVSVLAEVALNYIEVRTFQTRLAVAQSNLSAQQESYELIKSRFEAGFTNDLALDQARTNVELTRADVPSLTTSLEAAKNRLTTLLGVQPGALQQELASAAPIPSAPVTVTIGVPADTLRRRPDIRQAERQLAAETARVGAVTAELYPSFSLSGSIGLESLQRGNLLSTASEVFSFLPAISWPLFDAGRIRSNIAVQSAIQDEALINYEQSVLLALEEVENSLTAYANEQVRNHALREAATAATHAADTAQEQYDAGLIDFLTVLDAQRTRLSAQDSLAISDAEIVSNLVRLYKALGGGWETLEAVQQ